MKLSDGKLKSGEYNLRIDGFYSQYWDAYSMDFHKHERLEVMYVTSGNCNIFFLREDDSTDEVILKQGEMILIDADVWHKMIIDGTTCHIVNLEFLFEKKASLCSIDNIIKASDIFAEFIENFLEYCVVIDDGNIYALIKMILHERMSCDSIEDRKISLMLLTINLLLSISRAKRISDQRLQYVIHVKKALKYIHSHYNSDIKMTDIADYVNLNHSYLERLFKEAMGVSIVKYNSDIRINKAVILLDNTSKPISEISAEVGFKTRQQFNNAFKQRKGISPQEYRLKNTKRSKDVLWYGFNGEYEYEEKK